MISRLSKRTFPRNPEALKPTSFARSRALHDQARKTERGNNETIRLAGLMPAHMIELLDKLPEMVHIIDRNGRIVYANNVWLSRLGKTENKTVGSSIFDHLPEAQRETAMARFKIKLAGGTVEKVIDRMYLAEKGEKVYVNTSDQLLRDQSGEVALIITVLQDITQVRRMAAQTAVNAIMGVIARGFGENLRNMLQPIGGQAAYIGRLANEPATKELAQKIGTATKRAKEFLDRFIVLARWRAGDIEIYKYDLRQILGASFDVFEDMMGLTYEDKEKVMMTEQTERLLSSTVMMEVDVKVVSQVLAELYKNGVEAGGDVTLEIDRQNITQETIDDLRNVLKPGEYLRFTVRDSGCGIDKNARHDIFKLFFTQKPQEAHTGLGLSLVYAGVTAHKGGVTVESEEGAGTAIHLYIPAVQANGNGF
ncbi:MAG: ATP-binding protein [Candidatus Margulisiibacteriota bacterium]|jgi:PAS domain S-box-containing protein